VSFFPSSSNSLRGRRDGTLGKKKNGVDGDRVSNGNGSKAKELVVEEPKRKRLARRKRQHYSKD
jgi:hypothetical protein